MNRNTMVFIVSVIGFTGLVFYLLMNSSSLSNSQQGASVDTSDDVIDDPADTPEGEDVEELLIETITAGEGDKVVENGDLVTVHYTGTLLDGTKFDSSIDRDTPFPFTVGSGSVIRGWDEGVLGMKVGELRKLTIPSDLAYGPAGRPPTIPGGSALVFEIELLSVE